MTHGGETRVDPEAPATQEHVTRPRIRIVGMGGSLAGTSASLAALKVALDGAAAAGADTQVLDLRVLDLPMFLPTVAPPDPVVRFCNAVYAAHGLLWSSPQYNGTVSGAFKNAIDWLHLLGDRQPPYLTNKVVGLISTAGGVHALQTVNTMEFITRSLRAWAVPLVLPIPRASEVFGSDGSVHDTRVAGQLRALGQEVARAARQMTLHGYCDWMDDQGAGREDRGVAERIGARGRAAVD
jgi:FMN reductase